MKKICYILVLLPMIVIGQSATENYIKSTTYKKPSSPGPIDFDNPADVAIQVTYFDGLGRPIQQVAKQQSSSGKSIVTHIEYDGLGRQVKEYLPYTSNATDVNFVTHAGQETLVYYSDPYAVTGNPHFELTTNPYSEKLLEASPLNRVFKQSAPGNDWALNPTGSDHSIKFDYQSNDIADYVKQFSITTDWDSGLGLYDIITFEDDGYYVKSKLYKTITKNENWTGVTLDNTTEEFKDKEGKIILKRTFDNEHPHDTYYVYDDYGNLTYVIPPLVEAHNTIDDTILNGLCYQYKYDHRNRLVEKKLPGKDWEFIVYDKLDRVVSTGPALSPFGDSTEGWMFTKYDAFGRVCYTGWYSETFTANSRKNAQSSYNTATSIYNAIRTSGTIDGISIDYSDTNIPSGLKLLTVNYYDNYTYPNAPSLPTEIETQTVLTSVRGLATGNWTRVLVTSNNTYDAETSYTLYDEKSRPIRTHKSNYLGGYSYADSKLDFTGKPLYSITTHKRVATNFEIVTRDDFTYTPQDRLAVHTQTLNNGTPQLIAANEYDELGQLIKKNVAGTDTTTFVGVQTIDYRYNIRGWLTQINDPNEINPPDNDLFGFKISYNTVNDDLNQQVKPLYNGNISETYWKTSTDNVTRKYSYAYDNLNRLNKAFYQKPGNTVPLTHSYDEELLYDKNGNIITLLRNGDSDSDDINVTLQIDNLMYSYNQNMPNQLLGVSDGSNSAQGFKDDDGTQQGEDYTYDNYGNMKSDRNKDIEEITYNHLNLPTQISFGSGETIKYFYNALGQKAQKEVVTLGNNASTKVTDYLDGYQYTNGILNFFPHAEGYINATPCELCTQGQEYIFNYVFNYTDHLGNIRVSYGIDPQTHGLKILEQNHYYPFGLKHTNYNSDLKHFEYLEELLKIQGVPAGGELEYKYKFQGQERQDELGLNWDSFKWRNYDYAIGRFMSIDPLTEEYHTWSPYVFSGNRVIDSRELEGLEPHSTNKDFQEASRNFSQQYNGYSIREKVEVATQYYKCPDGTYSYATPVQGAGAGVNYAKANDIPSDAVLVGFDHTHGYENETGVHFDDKVTNRTVNSKSVTLTNIDDYEVMSSSNKPSDGDMQRVEEGAQSMGSNFEGSHVFTPSGLAYSIKVVNGKAEAHVNKNLTTTNPSQTDAAKRFSNVAPDTEPDVKPTQIENVYGID